jgi:hypothetical protein
MKGTYEYIECKQWTANNISPKLVLFYETFMKVSVLNRLFVMI